MRRKTMHISMIAAVGRRLEIGKDNALLWRLDGDLPFFKRVTMGKPVIMGRRTFLSLPCALPGRRNVVLTHDKEAVFPGAETAATLAEAMALCGDAQEVFIIGGEQVYAQFLPLATRLYLTEAEAEDETADAYFPAFDKKEWTMQVLDEGGTDIPYRHVLYTREKK